MSYFVISCILYIAFEPVPSNLFYFTRSIKNNINDNSSLNLNYMDNIVLYPIGLGYNRGPKIMYSQLGIHIYLYK